MRCRKCEPLPEQVRRVTDLLERRWTISILYVSNEGAVRFNEFLQALGSIPPATLTQRLADLENAGILERGAPEEGELDDAFVGLAGTDPAVVRPDRRARAGGLRPLPLFDDVRVCFLDEAPHLAQRLAAPVVQLGDSRVDQLGSIGLVTCHGRRSYRRIRERSRARRATRG